MGDDREAVGFHDTGVVSDKVANRVSELANRMDEALHFKQPTRERNRSRNRNLKAKSKGALESAPSVKAVVTASSWRHRVQKAKDNAAATLSIMHLLESNLTKTRNYYDFVPPAIEESLDDDYKKFLAQYAEITKVLADVGKAAQDKKAKADAAPKKKKKNPLNVEDKKKAEEEELLDKTGVSAKALMSTENSAAARSYAIDAISKSKQTETDDLYGVAVKDERISGCLTLMETYLSRANEVEGIAHKDEDEDEDEDQSQPSSSPLKNPATQSHDVWMNNPGSKPEVLRMTSEAKSNAKYGRIAMLIFAADLGPERQGSERQPLWAVDPYEMLAEIHQEQKYEEYLKKAAALKKIRDDAVARGEMDESTEADLPIQPPLLTTPVTTHVEGMSIGARLMTQLVADVTENCGAKAIEALKVVLVVSNATESTVTKDLRRNDFYGLKRENVLFVTQPDLPGFRYVPAINLFREDSTAKSARYGTGFIIEQLTNPGEAFVITDATGTKGHLVESALDHLSSVGVEWIFKTRSRLIPSEMFDIKFMAHSMALKERLDANMIFDVVETTMNTCRRWGNIAAARPPNANAKLEAGSPYFTRIIGNEALSTSEAQAAMLDMLDSQPENAKEGERSTKTLYSATGRWMLSLAAMQEALDGIRFTPTFCLEYELEDEARLERLKAPPAIYPQVYAHDLTLVDAIRPLSISVDAEHAPKDIGQLDIMDPIGLIRYISKVQDAGPAFQNMVKKASAAAAAKGKDAPSLMMMSTGSAKRHIIMVAIAENHSCHAVLELVNSLVIPGVDEIHVVHFCKNSEAAPRAQKVISQFDVESAVQLTRHVLIQPIGRSLPEMLAQTAEEMKATMLVIASEKLVRSGEPKMGSVAVTLCRKNLPCSVLIVKSHSMAAKNASTGLSYVLGVHSSALEMFDWVCNIARRGQDKFYLANCSGSSHAGATTRNTNSGANIIQIFKDKAVSRGFMPVSRPLDGKASVELPKLAHQVQADIVVISAGAKSGEVSKGATAVLKDPLTSAVLIFKPTDDVRTGL
jgi:nucleotide-binding universal stress UspA family protein